MQFFGSSSHLPRYQFFIFIPEHIFSRCVKIPKCVSIFRGKCNLLRFWEILRHGRNYYLYSLKNITSYFWKKMKLQKNKWKRLEIRKKIHEDTRQGGSSTTLFEKKFDPPSTVRMLNLNRATLLPVGRRIKIYIPKCCRWNPILPTNKNRSILLSEEFLSEVIVNFSNIDPKSITFAAKLFIGVLWSVLPS